MGLDLWFRNDVRRILIAIATAAHSVSGGENTEYMRGYYDALQAVASGFGLRPDLDFPSETEYNDCNRITG